MVFLRLIGRHAVQHVQNALGQGVANRGDPVVLLQDLPGDVQGQVVGVHHTLDEAQVERQELLCLVHDEHPLHVQLETPRRFPIPEIERGMLGNVEQAGVFQLALHPVVAPGKGIVEVVGDVLVKRLVLVVLYLAARPGP